MRYLKVLLLGIFLAAVIYGCAESGTKTTTTTVKGTAPTTVSKTTTTNIPDDTNAVVSDTGVVDENDDVEIGEIV